MFFIKKRWCARTLESDMEASCSRVFQQCTFVYNYTFIKYSIDQTLIEKPDTSRWAFYNLFFVILFHTVTHLNVRVLLGFNNKKCSEYSQLTKMITYSLWYNARYNIFLITLRAIAKIKQFSLSNTSDILVYKKSKKKFKSVLSWQL